ncbi:MAG: ATP-binding cassette subfamily F protein uup [Cyclobacteriaceae bacterium]|jgi:ATP-binding cassette subfamily F protein uup
MNYLSVENLTKSYSEKQLFEGISFGLDQGQKAALVGVNGCGKSTLMKIIAGLEQQETGQVSFRKDLTISFLPQRPNFEPDDTVLEAVFDSDIQELSVIRQYEWALLQAEQGIEITSGPDLTDLIDQMDQLNAWDYEAQVKQILGQLGIHELEQKVSNLSGGQRKRIALARALVTNPDVLILDEPTNHLDLEIIEWLENYLATANMTLLMVTHDRYFLDKVTNEIFEIDQGKLFRYKGNYQHFLEKKSERETQDAATVSKAKNLLRKELEWMRRQPKARGTKAKYRIEAFHDTKEVAGRSNEVQKMEVNLSGDRQGRKIMELHHMNKSFGEQKILGDFSYVFKKKDRIGVVGANGTGKSTFLNLLTGEIPLDGGEIELGKTTKFGYYKQEEYDFDLSKRVIDTIKEIAEVITLNDGSIVTASQLLHQFLFPPESQYQPVGKLSGGERKRLQLLLVLMSNPNFLILDEPTNDLDLMTLNVLEDYLESFAGCLLIVSHDRYFMDRLTDHLFVFEGKGEVVDFPGNYTDLRINRPNALSEKKVEKETAKVEKSKVTIKIKLSYKEQRELQEVETSMQKLEKRKKKLSDALSSETEYEKLQALSTEIEQIKTDLDANEMRWLELSERASG